MKKEIVNLFQNGVSTDTPYSEQPSDTIRDSFNGTLMDIDKGLYKWSPLKGNSSILTFPETYSPLAYFSFPDELIVWLYSETLAAMIVSITFDSLYAATLKIIYINPELLLTKDKPLRVFGYNENENIKRVYFTDRNDEPYVLNIKDYVDRITILSDASNLELYKWYSIESGSIGVYDSEDMFVETYISGSSFQYKPSIIQGGDVYYVVTLAIARPFMPLEQLKWQPNAIPVKIEYNDRISGTMKYGNYKIGYRYGSFSGFVSPVILINTFSITKPGSGANDADKYQNSEGDSHLRNSAYGIQFKLSNYDIAYNYIEIILMHAIAGDTFENGIVAKTIELPSSGEILTCDIQNYNGLGTITINEIMLNPIPVRAIGDLTVIKKHAVIANFKERKELLLKQSIAASIEDEVYYLVSDVIGNPDYTTSTPIALLASPPGGYGTMVYPKQWYKVGSVAVTYNGTLYQPDTLFQATVPEVVTEVVTPVFVRKTNYDWVHAVQKYEAVELKEWLDYKDPINAAQASGFWGDTDIGLGILFYDKKMIPYFVRYLGKHHTGNRNMNSVDRNGETLDLLEPTLAGYSTKALSLIINNLDLTDVIDDIGGYTICMVPNTCNIVSEGWLEAIKYLDDETDDLHERYPFLSNPPGSGTENNFSRRANWYFYVSPEFLFKSDTSIGIQESDFLSIERYQSAPRITNWNFMGENPFTGLNTHTKGMASDITGLSTYYNYMHLYQKAYNEVIPTGAVAAGEINAIKKNIEIGIDKKTEIKFNDSQPGHFFKNLARRINYSMYPVGSKGILLQTERLETGIDLSATVGFGSFDNPTNFGITVVQQRRPNVEIGSSPYDIEKLEFVQISPIQIVDATFKAQIKNGLNYIVSGLQVFGGGCYINIFDHVRVMQDINERNLSGTNEMQMSHSDTVFIPLQSYMNLALRKGKHLAAVRSFDDCDTEEYTVINPNGISYNSKLTGETGMPGMWEDFLYDDSYHNLGNAFRYPALPANYIDQELFQSRMRYSTQKVNGETIDSFRRFLTNNFLDLDAQAGPIKNIDGTSGKLFYWQTNAVGYVPVGERELVPSSMGAPIQLGIGGMMERSDDIDTFHGNQHTFGLLKIATGFLWHDYLRNDMLFMSFGGQLKNISRDNSFAFWMKYKHPEIQNNDNPFSEDGGISCGFDPETKLAFFTENKPVDDAGDTFAICADTLRLMGRYSFRPKMYITHNNTKLLTPAHTENINTHLVATTRYRNVIKYGALYNWYAASKNGGTGVGSIAPAGWHVPSISEFITLLELINGNNYDFHTEKLRQVGYTSWANPTNQFATNDYSFSAVGIGERLYDGGFQKLKERGWLIAIEIPYSLDISIDTNDGIVGLSAEAGIGCRLIKNTSDYTPGETLTDIDGNVYPTTKIGNQVWMAANLAVIKYNDGTPIPNVTDNTAWAALTTGAYCWYDNDINNGFTLESWIEQVVTPDVSEVERAAFTQLYLHNSGDIGLFYDYYNSAFVDIVITTKGLNVKFDVMHFLTGPQFFDKIQYFSEYSGAGIDPFSISIMEDTTNLIHYKKIGDKWKVELPLTPKGRMSGITIKIRCILEPTNANQRDITLQQLRTFVRDYKL